MAPPGKRLPLPPPGPQSNVVMRWQVVPQYLSAAQVGIAPIRDVIKADPTSIISLIPNLHQQREHASTFSKIWITAGGEFHN